MSSDVNTQDAQAGHIFAEAVAIMARLRGPEGCPWDREQNFESIRKYTLEETYEVLDAIDRRNWPDLKDELGDLLLQVLFYSQIASESGDFDIQDVLSGLNRKLIRRHPHVFGDQASAAAGNAAQVGMEIAGIDSRQVLKNWDEIKRSEKASKIEQASILDSVPQSFPALMEAAKLGSKAAKSGFDWPDSEGVFAKLDEEIGELKAEMTQASLDGLSSKVKITGEFGDLLFTAVNLARHLGVDPELALRQTNRKFRSRFASMEAATELPLEQHSPDRLEELWRSAKVAEKHLAEVENS